VPGTISRADVSDVDFVDARELLSDGTDAYKSSVSITSVVGSTKTVTVSGGLEYTDDPVRAKDRVDISGNDAAGSYVIASVISDTQFTVSETIVDATGGTAAFRYPPGSESVGVDPTNLSFSSSTNLQAVLEDIDISPTESHSALKQLIHFIDDGPTDGWTSGAYKETLPSGNPFPTQEIWWTSSAKTHKIVSLDVTLNSSKRPTSEVWKIYAADGSTVLITLTDSISYTGAFETTRTRTWA
jgi:hypothetical protein